jgi:diaminopimelate decarboxylase
MNDMHFAAGPLANGAFQRNAKGELSCEGLGLTEIANEFGTPTFVYCERAIRQAFGQFSTAAQGKNSLICYALKANSNLAIIRLLAKQGAGFDIVSLGELQRVLAAGGQANKIVFSGVGKTMQELTAALSAGVKCINVESEAELEMVSKAALSVGGAARVSIRVNPDIDAKTHPYISTGLKENKFGIPMSRALAAYQRAQSLPGIEIHGIDCHIGSQITELTPFFDSLDRVLGLADALANTGIMVRHLDLGGGLGIAYQNEAPPSPQALLDGIFTRVEQWAKARGRDMPELLFEFGRAVVGNAGVLLTRVELLKPDAEKNFAVIDAAMNDLMRPSLYDAWHGVEPVLINRAAKEHDWDLVGPVCESGDWIAKDRRLALAAGDLLAILSAGAYGMSMSSNYNSRPRAAEVLVDASGKAHLIRRRERFDDLIGPEKIPDYLK